VVAERLEADHQTEAVVHYQAGVVIGYQAERLEVGHQTEVVVDYHAEKLEADHQTGGGGGNYCD